MFGKMKMLVDVFGKITTGALLAAAVFITAFWGRNSEIRIGVLWQILTVSAFCSLGILMFPSEIGKEISKKGMLIRRILYFLYANIVVLGLGSCFGWFSFHSWKMVLLMEILIIGIYALVSIISYLNDYQVAKSMNKKLSEKG